ncbi:Pectinesterase inhibitor [Corchorus olitorius]|uniref:Pectinesterase inhibitor n=1 Tax=Corchorus olitorius TaxID=93759 RepID=A0A1R3KYS2_9ROSI|nr:Pectinesterase inhibitor [Corchorus olitorius]
MVLNQNFSSAATAQGEESLISKACKESRNPDLCKSTLETDPLTKKAESYNSLCRVAMVVAISKIKKVSFLLAKSLAKESDFRNKSGIMVCTQRYDNALYALNMTAIPAFDEKNYNEAYHAVSLAGYCATACNDVCNEGGLTMFQQHNNEIYAFSSVVQSLLIKLVPADQL